MIAYSHTQRGTQTIVFSVLGCVEVGIVVLGLAMYRIGSATLIVPVVVLLILIVCATLFSRMTVRIENDRLNWWFGPGFPRFSRPLSEVQAADIWTPRSFALGIHRTRDGWLYNVSGMKGVQVTLGSGKSFILGTDEPEALRAALNAALEDRRRNL